MDDARFPVLSLRNTVVFPGIVLPLRVGRPKSISALLKAVENGSWIITVGVKHETGSQEAGPADVFHVGTLAKIEKVRGDANEGYHVVVRGDRRVRLSEFSEPAGYLEAKSEPWPDDAKASRDLDPRIQAALVRSLKEMAGSILKLVPTDTSQLQELVKGIDDLEYLSSLCASNLEIPMGSKQELLEAESLKDRALRLLELMQQQRESLEVQGEIRDRMAHKLEREQREAILRRHLSAIREELGEEEDSTSNESYRKKLEELGLPEEVKKVALDEAKRLESIGNASPESHVIRNYLDLLAAMPWTKAAQGDIDLEGARRVLDEDHYGLDKIKRRIVQNLAVMKLKKGGHGSILLFVGPPGVGKTSLGQSIARAMGRKFVRASLGGLRDDAEIRGHRRTYIGAMPGRIIQGIKRAGENNPVFMLDEIDKLARHFTGDPASALLEVLDPEQNSTFFDHYLDVPFDLSKVVFIATANTLESIPGPLLDRMEVIELTGYTTAEKLHIAKRHLVPKQLAEHGLRPEQLQVSDEAMLRVITHYTREAGVRELQRHIGSLCRAFAEKIVALPGPGIRVEASDLEDALGTEKFLHEVTDRISTPGVVTGLAWTPTGGEILFVESRLMQGSGQLLLTGQLGEVMKESAQIARSLVRSFFPAFDYDKNDLHIHVPGGAVPKDGPSAGVTIATAIASIVSRRSVSSKLAMTGEVTLRGTILPVGGIKEKIIAAHRAGVETVILSRRNERELKEVPDEVRTQLKFELVDTIGDVFSKALGITIGELSVQTNSPADPPASAVA